MGRKTLWVNFGENGRTYSISVPEGQAVFQVHRIKGGINFEANAAAMKVLSPKSYMLYMLMICRSPGKVWTLSPSLIQKHSTLSSDDLEAALQELSDHGYWTAGNIDTDGYKFSCDSFHVWESPSLNSTSSS